MKELIGKRIVAAYLSSDKTVLGFECDGGECLTYTTEGDCCSYSWIEHFSNSEYLAGSKVLGVEEIDMPGVEPHGDHEYIQCYGVKILLEGRPAFEFEYRNSSNGYYGGYITGPNKVSEAEWRKLLEISDFERLLNCQYVLES